MRSKNILWDMLLGVWIVIGLVADEFLHSQLHEEPFWSIPHAIIYLGMLALICRIIWVIWQNKQSGRSYSNGIGILSAISFLLGGIGDAILHLVFNLQDESILIRPTHDLIILGAILLAVYYWNDKKQNEQQ